MIPYGWKNDLSKKFFRSSYKDILFERDCESLLLHWRYRCIGNHFQSFEGIRVAVLGLAFKPGTDDMRESPAIPIINDLISHKATVVAYDPVAQSQAEKIFSSGDISYGATIEKTISGVDAILLLTRWPEFSEISELLNRMENQPVLIDGRRIIDKTTVQRYEGIGLQKIGLIRVRPPQITMLNSFNRYNG